MINFESLFKISYGIYLVSSGDKNKGNGFISNTVFQITADPPRFAASCNKNNFTTEFIQHCKAFAVSVLKEDASSELISDFGYKSGKEINKLEGKNIIYGETGVPIILNDSIAYMEFRLLESIDIDSHYLFIGELLNAELIEENSEPLTYAYYRKVKKGFSPKNAPTYIDKSKLEKQSKTTEAKKYKCPVCGYIYDDAVESIIFADLPDDWVCPLCGDEKSDFIEI